MSDTRTSMRRMALLVAAASILAAGLSPVPPAVPAFATSADDPALEQRVDESEALGEGETVLDAGHVDIGPYGELGKFQLAGRDDTQAPPVWRTLEDLVIHIPDEGGKLEVPDDPMYEFLGVDPGEEVWLIPQVEEQGVPWLGWNTQYPGFADASDSGIALTFHGMDGPGEFSLYLQDGAFGDPDMYWQSTKEGAQTISVDPLTHTHANWVFTAPGIYLLDIGITSEGTDGKPIEDRQNLRVAVGSEIDPQEAFGRHFQAQQSGAGENEDAAGADTASDEETSPIMYALVGVIGVLVLALVLGATIAVVRSRRSKAAAEQEIPAGTDGSDAGGRSGQS